MRVAIMQPTYLPWCGYFEMIDNVDVFILLDNVQFVRSSWQHRNRVKSSNGELMLTVPVKSTKDSQRLISDCEINFDHDFPRNHLESISRSYARAEYFSTFFVSLEKFFTDTRKLADFNENLIRGLCEELGIKTRIVRGSELKSKGAKTELSLNQCKELGATTFYAAHGSKAYVDLETGFQENNIKVEYQNYLQPTYSQLFGEFIPQLSVIDLLFNYGEKSLDLIKSGRVIDNALDE
jgi:hypothetical protein